MLTLFPPVPRPESEDPERIDDKGQVFDTVYNEEKDGVVGVISWSEGDPALCPLGWQLEEEVDSEQDTGHSPSPPVRSVRSGEERINLLRR